MPDASRPFGAYCKENPETYGWPVLNRWRCGSRIESAMQFQGSNRNRTKNLAPSVLCTYNKEMPITFDPVKSERNAAQRGLPLDVAEGFLFETAVIRQDTRFAYPERRFQSIGEIEGRIVMLVFTPTADGFRVISLRTANRKERTRWFASQP